MAPVPKRKHSRARQGKRRAVLKVTLPQLTVCPNCKAKILAHTVCRACGFYQGKPRIAAGSLRGKQILTRENRV